MPSLIHQAEPRIRPFLLWDVNLEQFDFSKNSKLVIERVCTLGNLYDLKEIIRFYGLDLVRQELRHSTALDRKSLYFFSRFFNIPVEQFKCYSKQPFLLQP